MIRPCRREYSCVEGGLRCSYALAPSADYDMSVLDLVIAGSLRGLHVVEVDEEDRDHCVVRVFRSPPRDDGNNMYIFSILDSFFVNLQSPPSVVLLRVAVLASGLLFPLWQAPVPFALIFCVRMSHGRPREVRAG